MDVKRFKELPIMGILRCAGPVAMEELIEAIISSGLETIEIAMNSNEAQALIRRAASSAKGRLTIGAGTVLDLETLKAALGAGAAFIVMPTLVKDVVEECVKKKIPVFPGAFSPQEIYDAWNAGATMVKVFPIAMFGPSYIKEIKAPLEKVELLACGGVRCENIGAYFANGSSAVAFGASIFKKEWLDRKDFKSIERSIKDLISKIPNEIR